MTDSYFVMRVEDPEVGYRARLVYTRDHPLRSWMTGVRFAQNPPEPIVLKLRGTDELNWSLGDLWLTPITVMSRRLYDAILRAGVDNLDAYSVELRDPENGDVNKDFVAFNVIGKRSIVGEANSGPLMFRLTESINSILIHERVKQAIESAGIHTLTFLESATPSN